MSSSPASRASRPQWTEGTQNARSDAFEAGQCVPPNPILAACSDVPHRRFLLPSWNIVDAAAAPTFFSYRAEKSPSDRRFRRIATHFPSLCVPVSCGCLPHWPCSATSLSSRRPQLQLPVDHRINEPEKTHDSREILAPYARIPQ